MSYPLVTAARAVVSRVRVLGLRLVAPARPGAATLGKLPPVGQAGDAFCSAAEWPSGRCSPRANFSRYHPPMESPSTPAVADPVQFRQEGEIAVITVDRPPVNALNTAVRRGLVEALGRAQREPAVAATVLTGAGRTFIAGADITEFDRPPQSPSTIDVIAAVEQMGKPVIAALHGTPLGGGFEIALACDFRIAAPGTRVGLPEI